MSELEKCSLCGIKSKFLYICPHCGEKYCSKHKKPEDHNCEAIEINNEPVLENKNPFENNYNLDILIDKSIEESNFLTESNVEVNEYNKNGEEINSDTNDFEELNTGIILDSSNIKKEEIDEKDLILYNNRLDLKPQEESNITDDDIIKQLESDSDKIVQSINYNSQEEAPKSRNMIKILGIVLLVTVVVSSISIFGHLYITDDIKKTYTEYSSSLEEANNILNSKYNELYLDYVKLEEKYSLLSNEYSEIEEHSPDEVNYTNEIILENMRQYTIDAESNSIFFYEIPDPGIITIECYSDQDISILVGSSMFENVYYARSPVKNTATEIFFTVPVVPDVNILISNNNQSQKATIFLGIKYNSLQ